MNFDFYNVTHIHGFTSILTVVCANTIMLWIFTTEYKLSPVHIIHFIPTILNNEHYPFKRVIVDEYGALANSIDATNLPVDEFNMSMENTVCDASWLNGNY